MKLLNVHFNQPLEIEFDEKTVVRLAPREEKEVSDSFKDHPVLESFKNDVEIFVEDKPKTKPTKDEK